MDQVRVERQAHDRTGISTGHDDFSILIYDDVSVQMLKQSAQ